MKAVIPVLVLGLAAGAIFLYTRREVHPFPLYQAGQTVNIDTGYPAHIYEVKWKDYTKWVNNATYAPQWWYIFGAWVEPDEWPESVLKIYN